MARSGQVWPDLPGDSGTPFPVNKDPHGATYEMVSHGWNDWKVGLPNEDVHYTGTLLPPACPRSDERVRAFDAGSVMDIRD